MFLFIETWYHEKRVRRKRRSPVPGKFAIMETDSGKINDDFADGAGFGVGIRTASVDISL